MTSTIFLILTLGMGCEHGCAGSLLLLPLAMGDQVTCEIAAHSWRVKGQWESSTIIDAKCIDAWNPNMAPKVEFK